MTGRPHAVAAPGNAIAASSNGERLPSWPRVIGTTLRLFLQRRVFPRSRGLILGTAALLAVAAVAAGLLLARPARHPAGPVTGTPRVPGLAAIRAAATARAAAARWVTGQVSHGAIVACDPLMCSALQEAGFPAGNLQVLGPSAADPLGSAVLVATPAVRRELGTRLATVYAPAVLAAFGSGQAQVAVRVTAPDGAATYLAALRADQRARQAAGRRLLRNRHVSAPPAVRHELAAGRADTRLLITIATLAARMPVRLASLGDAGPEASAGLPLRSAELASPPGPPRRQRRYRLQVLGFLAAQQPPYRAASVRTIRRPGRSPVVQFVFAAPSPLGLLPGS
jgi:hypothetical protein